MTEIKVNTGFGRYPVRDPITPPPTEEVEEELKKFPMPFGRLTIGFVMGVFVALTFAQYWQNKHYGEIIELQEQIKHKTEARDANRADFKELLIRVEWTANKDKEMTDEINQYADKLAEAIVKNIRVKPSIVVNK